VKASELLSNGKIAVRLNEVRRELKERGVLSIETHLDDLKRPRDLAAQAGLYAAAIKAEELRGKIGGFYVERQKVGKPNDFSHMSQDELWRSIEEDMADFGFVRLEK